MEKDLDRVNRLDPDRRGDLKGVEAAVLARSYPGRHDRVGEGCRNAQLDLTRVDLSDDPLGRWREHREGQLPNPGRCLEVPTRQFDPDLKIAPWGRRADDRPKLLVMDVLDCDAAGALLPIGSRPRRPGVWIVPDLAPWAQAAIVL